MLRNANTPVRKTGRRCRRAARPLAQLCFLASRPPVRICAPKASSQRWTTEGQAITCDGTRAVDIVALPTPCGRRADVTRMVTRQIILHTLQLVERHQAEEHRSSLCLFASLTCALKNFLEDEITEAEHAADTLGVRPLCA